MSLIAARCGNYIFRVKDPNGLASFGNLNPRVGPIRLQWGDGSIEQTGGLLPSNGTIVIEDTPDHKIRGLFNDVYTESHFPVEIEGPWGERNGGTWHGYVKRTQRSRPTSFEGHPRRFEMKIYDGLRSLEAVGVGSIAGRTWGDVLSDLTSAQNRDVRFQFGFKVAEGDTALLGHNDMRRYCEYPDDTATDATNAFEHLRDLAQRNHMLIWHEPLTERWEACHIKTIGEDRNGGLLSSGVWSNTLDGKKQRTITIGEQQQKRDAYGSAILTSIEAEDDRTDYAEDLDFSDVDSNDFTYWVESGDVTEPSGTGVYLGVGSDGSQAGTVYQELIHKGQETIDVDLTWGGTDQSGDGTGELTVELQIMEDGSSTWSTLVSRDGLTFSQLSVTVSKVGRLRLWAQGKDAYWDPSAPLNFYIEGTTTDISALMYDQVAGTLQKTQPVTKNPDSLQNTVPGAKMTRFAPLYSSREYRSHFEYRAREQQQILTEDTWSVRGLEVRGVHSPLVRLLLKQDDWSDTDTIPFVASGGREVNLFAEKTTLNDVSV